MRMRFFKDVNIGDEFFYKGKHYSKIRGPGDGSGHYGLNGIEAIHFYEEVAVLVDEEDKDIYTAPEGTEEKELLSPIASDLVRRHVLAEKYKTTRTEFKEFFTQSGWWKEIGGVFVASPRQSGKTTALIEFAEVLAEAHPDQALMLVAPFNAMANLWKTNSVLDYVFTGSKIELPRGLDYSKIHLLIDEFDYIKESLLNNFLGQKWVSVTGIGTLKF